MDLAELYGTLDVTKQAKWFTHEASGIEFFIAPAGNIKAKKVTLETFTFEDVDGGIRKKTAMEALVNGANITAQAVLLDWKNVTIDGKEMKYSHKAAVDLLVTYEALRQFVEQKAAELAKEIADAKEEVTKK